MLRDEAGVALDAAAVDAFLRYYSGRKGIAVLAASPAAVAHAAREVLAPAARALPALGASAALTAPVIAGPSALAVSDGPLPKATTHERMEAEGNPRLTGTALRDGRRLRITGTARRPGVDSKRGTLRPGAGSRFPDGGRPGRPGKPGGPKPSPTGTPGATVAPGHGNGPAASPTATAPSSPATPAPSPGQPTTPAPAPSSDPEVVVDVPDVPGQILPDIVVDLPDLPVDLPEIIVDLPPR